MIRNLPCVVLLAWAIAVGGCSEKPKPPVVDPKETNKVNLVIETPLGDIAVELWPDKAPQTVKNFLDYVDEGFYGGTIFHRVIPGFMIQGGGMTPDMKQKDTHLPVFNEARSDVRNLRGTLAMARTDDLHSATAQFFINVADNASLDHKDNTARGWGYAVFGRVASGMDVADKIVSVPTTALGPMKDAPIEMVIIKSVRRVQAATAMAPAAGAAAPATAPAVR